MSFSSDSSSSSPAAALDWKFSQVFGDKLPGEDVRDSKSLRRLTFHSSIFTSRLLTNLRFLLLAVDVISAIEFDKSGDHLAVGDRGGRVVIFQENGGKDDLVRSTPRKELERLDRVIAKHPKFHYKTEFQSHEPEVKDRQVKQVKEMETSQPISSENSLLGEKSFINGVNGHSLEWKENVGNGVSSYNGTNDKIACLEDASVSRSRKVYAHAHDFSINSISVNSDWETFLSGDDLRINLWNLEVSNQCFNIIDMKPLNMEDLIEVITAVEFHPSHCNLLAYSSSRGFIRLVDMRKSALCDHSATILKDEEFHGQKSFFTEIIASITDMKFANDGRHILSRDFMNLKLWDMHMDSGPVATIRIHENLRPKLADLYNNDAIFDKFECCVSKDHLNFATGSYSNILRVFSNGSGAEGVTIEASRNPTRKPQGQTTSRPRRSSLSNIARGFYRQVDGRGAESNEFSYDFNSKLLYMAWHPSTNLIACAAGSSLLMYHA
ncbi:hypothetical protein AAHA92_03622 [Salvia divinorum]|uniref:Serine/threonine-protein phosphatase 2A 55 kDa regulatory subunit B n=1 Tax=Salvia divinorum TaxID=28513 RepID=A0ABD1IHN8_SALDI